MSEEHSQWCQVHVRNPQIAMICTCTKPTLTLRLVTDEQGQQYIDRGKNWQSQHSGFESGTPKYAVAEFLANEAGFTLYESRVGKPYNRTGR